MLPLTLILGIFGALALAWLAIRRDVFRRIAAFHESEASRLAREAEGEPRPSALLHQDLSDKYRRASRRPWRPVEPDPTLPR